MDIRDPDLTGLYDIKSPQGGAKTLQNEDLWIELSIKGKRRKLLKQEIKSHIRQIKTHVFDYRK